LGGTVGGDACQATEHEHVHDGGEDGLDDKPERTEDGLLIDGDDIAFDIHVVEVAVAPEVLYIYIKPTLLGSDFDGPIGHFSLEFRVILV